MRSRTITFIPDPFAPRRFPIGVIVEHVGRVSFEPIPLPNNVEPTVAALARMEANNLRESPAAERPELCGPHVVFGPWHDPRKTLPRDVFDALNRAVGGTDYRADIDATVRAAEYIFRQRMPS